MTHQSPARRSGGTRDMLAPVPKRSLARQLAVPRELIELSRWLGHPAQDCAILGEGNTSCLMGVGETFFVKASGARMGSATSADFVQVKTASVLALVDARPMDADLSPRELIATKVNGQADPLPSVETVVHAVCFEELRDHGLRFIGHSHPTAVNAFTCSKGFAKALRGRLFPDQTVLCGPASVLVPYADPGAALAREVRRRLRAFLKAQAEMPATMYLQNHGFVALGKTAKDVMNITAMAVKAARIQIGSDAFGGPNFMRPRDVERIHTRADEEYRRKVIAGRGSASSTRSRP